MAAGESLCGNQRTDTIRNTVQTAPCHRGATCRRRTFADICRTSCAPGQAVADATRSAGVFVAFSCGNHRQSKLSDVLTADPDGNTA